MTAPSTRAVFFSFVDPRRDAPGEGERRPALAALRLRELAAVTQVALLYDEHDDAARAAAEHLAEDVQRRHRAIQSRALPVPCAEAHTSAAVATPARHAVEALVREYALQTNDTGCFASIASGTMAQCAALLDALDGLGLRSAVVYDTPGETLSIWRSTRACASVATIARLGDAPAAWNVLVEGPPGSEPASVARQLHEAWQRAFLRKGRFVVFDVAATPREALASELFGRGTNPRGDLGAPRDGALSRADGGTLFINEIGELPREFQPRILRALELDDARMRFAGPHGDNPGRPLDVRVVVGTCRELHAMARAGTFYAELLGRVSTHRVTLPALASARHQIVSVYHHQFENVAAHYPSTGKGPPRFVLRREARQELHAHVFSPASSWRSNHQDVSQSVERLCLRAWAERPGGPPPSVVKVTPAHVTAEIAELTARWAALDDPHNDSEREDWAAVEARTLPGAWRELSLVERWELRYLLEARDATQTNADAWRYIAERNLLEGASDPRSLHNASNAFDKRWRRYAAKLRSPR